jgi:hypothetical protein
MSYDAQEQAKAILVLVKENEQLTKLKNAVIAKRDELAAYNEKMNHKQHVTEVQESLLNTILRSA